MNDSRLMKFGCQQAFARKHAGCILIAFALEQAVLGFLSIEFKDHIKIFRRNSVKTYFDVIFGEV